MKILSRIKREKLYVNDYTFDERTIISEDKVNENIYDPMARFLAFMYMTIKE